MADYDEAQRLLSAAYKNLQAVRAMTDTIAFADEIFGFHAQQTIEKTLKAWLALRGIEYPKTHDIALLLSMLANHGQPVEPFYDLIEFNPYAVQFRYEAFDEIGEPLDRDTVIARVGELVRQVQALLDDCR